MPWIIIPLWEKFFLMGISKLFGIPAAALRTVFYLFPVFLPFLSPSKRALTDDADFFR
jgi:hypothetical protein